MNAEYVNPFLEAAALVYKDLLGAELLRGKTNIKQAPRPGHDIAIGLTVTGAATGRVVYSMNIETVVKIVQRLMPGSTREAVMSEYKDVLGELANMITGNAVNIFLKSGADIEISVPDVVDTRQGDMSVENSISLCLNLYCSYGLLEVNIAFENQ